MNIVNDKNVIDIESERVDGDNNGSTNTATQNAEEGDRSSVQNNCMAVAVANYPSLDLAASAWARKSIPNAHPPVLYLGDRLLGILASLVQRPLTLEEVQHLVQPDGEMATCAIEGKEFQPVRFAFLMPNEAKAEEIRQCESLTQVNFLYAGAFYANLQTGMVVAVSGTTFFYDRQEERYKSAYNSNLIAVAREMKRQTGKFQLGMCRERLDTLFHRREERKEARKHRALKTEQLVKELLGGVAGSGNFADAFAKAESKKAAAAKVAPTKKEQAKAKGGKKRKARTTKA